MKKLLFVLSMIALFSCEKEPTYCWQCNKEIFAENAYSSSVSIVCDMSEDEARAYERSVTKELGAAAIVMTCRLYE